MGSGSAVVHVGQCLLAACFLTAGVQDDVHELLLQPERVLTMPC